MDERDARLALELATDPDLDAVADLLNLAYRGPEGWTTEAGYMDGDRITAAALRAECAAQPGARLLLLKAAGQIDACVQLEPAGEGVWRLGLLTVRPDLQAGGVGRRLLQAAESEAAARGAERIRLTVVNVRSELIGWYERRGYRRSGAEEPYPYDELPYGAPRRGDLCFLVLEKPLRRAGSGANDGTRTRDLRRDRPAL